MNSFTSCLRQIIVVQQAILEDDLIGGHIETWQDMIMLSAEVKTLGEYKVENKFNSKQIEDASKYRIRIRYMPKLTCNMRIIYNGKTLRILRIINQDERDVVTLIIAQEYQENGLL